MGRIVVRFDEKVDVMRFCAYLWLWQGKHRPEQRRCTAEHSPVNLEEGVLHEQHAISIMNVVGVVPAWSWHREKEHALVEERVGHGHEGAVWMQGWLIVIHGEGQVRGKSSRMERR